MKGKKLCFISHAGTAKYKGWYYLINAVKNLPLNVRDKIKIVLIGQEPTTKAKEYLCNGDYLPDIVSFVGFHSDCRRFLEHADIGFILSTSVETISFAAREMMAHSLPLFVSDFGGLSENMTAGKNGWIVNKANCKAIEVFLIETLMLDTLSPDEIRHYLLPFKANARKKAEEEFGLKKMVDATEQVYKKLLIR